MTLLKALAISILFLAGGWLIFRRAFILAFGKGFLKKHFDRKFWYVFSAVVIIGLIVVLYITSHNSGIYAWDSGGYWVWSYKHTEQLYADPNLATQNLYNSITGSDYNLILPTVISLPLKIFGYTFIRYVSINYLLFLVPALLTTICICVKITADKKQQKSNSWWVAILAAACLPVPMISILQGYIDVAVLIPIALVFALTINYDPLDKPKNQWRGGLMIGLMLTITFLFRRYTAFFVVGYAITMAVYIIYRLISERKKNKNSIKPLLKNVVLNMLVVAGVAMVILLGVFSKLVFRILSENYAELYSAYNAPLLEKILDIVAHFGILILLVGAIGTILSYKKRRRESQKMVFFCVATVVITATMFFRVQSMNGHHIYTLTTQVLILLFLGLYAVINSKKAKLATKCILIIALLLGAISCYSTRIFNIIKPASIMFQKHYTNILHRDDIATIREIRDDLNAINADGKSTIYVLSSSVMFNSDTLMVMDRPAKDNAVIGLAKTHDIDLRDGFPNVFFDADIIVTTNPIGTHTAEGSQEIVRYLAEQVQDETSYLGRHYEKSAEEYEIAEDIKVYIYLRTSDFSEHDYERLSEHFDGLYPEYPKMFLDRIESARADALK